MIVCLFRDLCVSKGPLSELIHRNYDVGHVPAGDLLTTSFHSKSDLVRSFRKRSLLGWLNRKQKGVGLCKLLIYLKRLGSPFVNDRILWFSWRWWWDLRRKWGQAEARVTIRNQVNWGRRCFIKRATQWSTPLAKKNTRSTEHYRKLTDLDEVINETHSEMENLLFSLPDASVGKEFLVTQILSSILVFFT